ncbi:hypothetical protein [Cellulosilyticum sp. I15G10I2]|uniref:hypothetical protein n=1 Tax=Cellulosilyticum sp. I15G10I2 TaxID=1892843 RepID=UPI00085CB384|nr:hypothetical protein [Cellulosilyticum sp. I15G10I2]
MQISGTVVAFVSLFVGLCSIASFIIGQSKGAKTEKEKIAKESLESGEERGGLKTDISYIKRGIEDIRIDMRAQEKVNMDFRVELTTVKESVKSAHHRIDELGKRSE